MNKLSITADTGVVNTVAITIDIDLAKNVFAIHTVNAADKQLWSARPSNASN